MIFPTSKNLRSNTQLSINLLLSANSDSLISLAVLISAIFPIGHSVISLRDQKRIILSLLCFTPGQVSEKKSNYQYDSNDVHVKTSSILFEEVLILPNFFWISVFTLRQFETLNARRESQDFLHNSRPQI